MNLSSLTVTCFITLVVCGGISAAEQRFTLRDAVQVAFEQNDELRAFSHSASAVGEDVAIARSALIPKISFEERFMRTNNPTGVFSAKLNQERFEQADFAISSLNDPAPINDFQTQFSISQPLLVRREVLGLSIAKEEYTAKSDEYKRKREEVALKVIRAYLAVHTTEGFTATAEKAVEDAKEHLRVANLRYTTGVGLYSDVLRASTAMTEAEQRLISARTQWSVAKRALGLLLGTAESADVAETAPDLPLKDMDYYMAGIATRSDVTSLEARCEQAKSGVKLAQAGYLPFIGVGGSYQHNDHRNPFSSEGDSWFLTAFLRWDIFDGGRRKHEVSKAKYKVSEMQANLEGLKKAVAYRIYEAYLGVEEAKKGVELSRAAVTTSEEGRRLVKERYENSLSPLTDLLDVQLSLDHARAASVAKENDYRLSIATLSYESGTILKDLGLDD